MPQARTRVLTAHVPIELAEKTDELAGRLERSRGGLSNKLFWPGLSKKKRKTVLPLKPWRMLTRGGSLTIRLF